MANDSRHDATKALTSRGGRLGHRQEVSRPLVTLSLVPPFLLRPCARKQVSDPVFFSDMCRGSKFLSNWMDWLENHADLRYVDASSIEAA